MIQIFMISASSLIKWIDGCFFFLGGRGGGGSHTHCEKRERKERERKGKGKGRKGRGWRVNRSESVLVHTYMYKHTLCAHITYIAGWHGVLYIRYSIHNVMHATTIPATSI